MLISRLFASRLPYYLVHLFGVGFFKRSGEQSLEGTIVTSFRMVRNTVFD